MTYDPDSVRQYFDAFSEREWDRLSNSIQGRIKYRIHRQFLAQVVRPEMHVLDAGCGPGRFAIDLIKLGANVTLVDLSSVQLELARSHLSKANLLQGVTAIQQGDITRLDTIDDATFDVTICFCMSEGDLTGGRGSCGATKNAGKWKDCLRKSIKKLEPPPGLEPRTV